MPTSTSERTALIFPGQGAPAPEWHEPALALVPALVDLAAELSGDDPFARFGESTEFDQLAVYCASIAAFQSLGRPGADFCAGHSLGEIAALVAAGALDPSDGVRVVAARGRAMARACRDGGPGAMLAARAGEAELRPVAAAHELIVANLNSPRQTVLSGPRERLEAAAAELGAAGIRTKFLPIAGAFHSPGMAAAADELAAALAAVELRPRRIPVLSARTGAEMVDPRAELVAALTAPVRWIDVVRTLEWEGVGRWVEVGPGRALGRLVAQILDSASEAVIETTPLPKTAPTPKTKVAGA